MDWDLATENGFAVDTEELMVAMNNWENNTFDYSTDLDGDGYTHTDELLKWINNWSNNEPGDYLPIRQNLGNYLTFLDWPNHPWDFDCALWGSPCSGVPPFIGVDNSVTGWLNVHEHAHSGSYVCRHFTADTAYCSYKSVGYGFFLMGLHGDNGHGYVIFLKYDGTNPDWHNLHDWAIVEPQTGRIYDDAAAVPDAYKTKYIRFPYKAYREGGELRLDYAALEVDYDHAEVSYSNYRNYMYSLNACEELRLIPEDPSYFETYLS